MTREDGDAGHGRRPPRPPPGQRRARSRAAHAQRRQGDRPGLLAAHQGHAPARPGPRLRGQHHRERHAGQGRRAAPALPGRGGPAARLQPRLHLDAPARRRPRGRVPGRLVRGRPARPPTAGSSRSRSPTRTRPRSGWPRSCAAATRPTRRPRTASPASCAAARRSSTARSRTSCSSSRSATPSSSPRCARSGMRSVMIVPMRLGDTTLGALTLVTADSGRRFERHRLRLRPGPRDPRRDRDPERPPLRGAGPRRAHAAVQPAARAPAAAAGLPHRRVLPGGRAGRRGRRRLLRHRAEPATAATSSFLGDVTGKGIAAAALTSLVRHSVRTAARFDPRPEAILALVNDILVEQPRLLAGHARRRPARRAHAHRRRRRPPTAAAQAPEHRPGDRRGRRPARRRARPHLRTPHLRPASRATRCCSTPTA